MTTLMWVRLGGVFMFSSEIFFVACFELINRWSIYFERSDHVKDCTFNWQRQKMGMFIIKYVVLISVNCFCKFLFKECLQFNDGTQ